MAWAFESEPQKMEQEPTSRCTMVARDGMTEGRRTRVWRCHEPSILLDGPRWGAVCVAKTCCVRWMQKNNSKLQKETEVITLVWGVLKASALPVSDRVISLNSQNMDGTYSIRPNYNNKYVMMNWIAMVHLLTLEFLSVGTDSALRQWKISFGIHYRAVFRDVLTT